MLRDMAVGKSNRIVIDVDDVDLKRRLHSALAKEGRNLKEWFVLAATEYLAARVNGGRLEFPVPQAAEEKAIYGAASAVDSR